MTDDILELQKTLVREEQDKIPSGIYHLVCEILVRHTDGTYLLMKRDPTKPLFPNMWEATAGGSALQGESPLECVKRELREETGILTDYFIEVGRVLHQRHQTYYVNYLCHTDVDKESIVLQEGETSAYKWVTAEELRQMSREELATQRIQNFIEELS
ncbi:NUDIX domain-containing protein [uncultured Streptococcus sp.]|uniref:NUDIX hydrolase n=1 Tax=uncultured Streptococcus sp. TaxID=83427 RepID=UPI002582F424|nr:NUDIX domain-containing protein [uncultured Streptococcus sp.]